jgi:hypothetical protein
MIDIVELTLSKKPTKRFHIKVTDGITTKGFDFGAKHGSTYIDHHDKNKRSAYLARHLANHTERERIIHLIPSNALFAARLLWGSHTDLFDNLTELQKDFRKKHE